MLEKVTYHIMTVLIVLFLVTYMVIPVWIEYDYAGVPGLLIGIGFWIVIISMLVAIDRSIRRMIRDLSARR